MNIKRVESLWNVKFQRENGSSLLCCGPATAVSINVLKRFGIECEYRVCVVEAKNPTVPAGKTLNARHAVVAGDGWVMDPTVNQFGIRKYGQFMYEDYRDPQSIVSWYGPDKWVEYKFHESEARTFQKLVDASVQEPEDQEIEDAWGLEIWRSVRKGESVEFTIPEVFFEVFRDEFYSSENLNKTT